MIAENNLGSMTIKSLCYDVSILGVMMALGLMFIVAFPTSQDNVAPPHISDTSNIEPVSYVQMDYISVKDTFTSHRDELARALQDQGIETDLTIHLQDSQDYINNLTQTGRPFLIEQKDQALEHLETLKTFEPTAFNQMLIRYETARVMYISDLLQTTEETHH